MGVGELVGIDIGWEVGTMVGGEGRWSVDWWVGNGIRGLWSRERCGMRVWRGEDERNYGL